MTIEVTEQNNEKNIEVKSKGISSIETNTNKIVGYYFDTISGIDTQIIEEK